MRRLHRPLLHLSLAVAIAAAAVVSGCSTGDDQTVSDVAEQLRSLSGQALTEDQAECVATGLIDAFGEDDFARVIAAAQNRTEGDASGDLRTDVINVWASCDAIAALIDGATEVESDTGADDA